MATKQKKPAAKATQKPVPEPEIVEDETLVEVEEFEPARRGPSDETIPGGRYLVGGRLVNAEGEPID